MGDISVQADKREAGLCPHFGECGGCQHQDAAYGDQLRAKERGLEELLAPYWDRPIEVLASPRVWHYRNRVDFNFALKRYDEPPPKDFVRDTVLGFTRPGKWYWPLDIAECRIGPERTAALMQGVREWYRREGLSAFDARAGTGFLRVLLVREGARTGEGMVVLITSEGAFDAPGFVEAVRAVYPATSIYRGVTHRLARGAFADESEKLYGNDTIEECLHVPTPGAPLELRFRISPFSFFQTNSLGAEVLYGEICRWLERIDADVLYDLYGGSGGIALSCAGLVKVVRSVDSVPEARWDGLANAGANGIGNVFFATEKMERYFQQLANEGGMERNSAAVVDPPRAGLNPKALRRLLKCRPPHLMYVSCKPSVLAEELAAITEHYTLVSVQAVDLFPHTDHVEVLAALRLR